jgi:hypothetical protein
MVHTFKYTFDPDQAGSVTSSHKKFMINQIDPRSHSVISNEDLDRFVDTFRRQAGSRQGRIQ